MKHTLFAVAFMSLVSGFGQPVDDIIQSYIRAIGGQDAVMAVKTKSMETSIETPGGNVIVANLWKRPGYYFSTMTMPDGNVIKTLFRQESGQIQGGENPATETSPEQAQDLRFNEADIDGVFIDYSKKGHKATLAGSEEVAGKPCHKVSINLASGTQQVYWIDKASNLIVKYQRMVVGMMGEVELTRELSDYKEVAGVKYPFTFHSLYGTAEYTTKVNSLKVNEHIPDTIFDPLK